MDVVVLNAYLRHAQQITRAVVELAQLCGRTRVQCFLWQHASVTGSQHAATLAELEGLFKLPMQSAAARAWHVVLARDVLEDASFTADAVLGSAAELAALPRSWAGKCHLTWTTSEVEQLPCIEALPPAAHRLCSSLALRCSWCQKQLLAVQELSVHQQADVLMCRTCSERCPCCDTPSFPVAGKQAAPKPWCAVPLAARGGSADTLRLCFRASPLLWAAEACAVGVPWRSAGCNNCARRGTHAQHSALEHVRHVHGWDASRVHDNPDRQMSATTQLTTALRRAFSHGQALHLMLVDDNTVLVDLSSPASRDAACPEWWCLQCGISPEVVSYGALWGELLNEVIFSRAELPARGLTVAAAAFSSELRERLDYAAGFECEACAKDLEQACRAEALGLVDHLL